MKKLLFGLSALILAASNAQAEELHLICKNARHSIPIDIDTTRLSVTLKDQGFTTTIENGMHLTPTSEYTSNIKDVVTANDDQISFERETTYKNQASDKTTGYIDRHTGILTLPALGG